MTPTLVRPVTAETADRYEVEATPGSFGSLSLARCAAAAAAMRLKHGIKIYFNGKMVSYKRF